jgi:foldase protein PrsA
MIAAALAGCGRGTVAEISGKKISRAEFAKYLQKQGGTRLLNQMLDDRLALTMAQDKGVEPTDEQVELQLKSLKNVMDLDEEMKQRGLTLEDVKDQLRVAQARQNLALQAMGKQISDEEVSKSYKPQVYDVPERMRVELIGFPTKDAADKASNKIKGGATLEQVGDDTEIDHGPLLRRLIPKSGPGVPPGLAKVAFDTPKNQVSKPIEVSVPTRKAWIILRPEDRIPAVKMSLAEVKPLIRGQLALDKANQDAEYQKQLREARRVAKVKVFDPALKQVEKDFVQR